MSILPHRAEVNEVEFNKTRAATHFNTLHLAEHAKSLEMLQQQIAAIQEQIGELRCELKEAKGREESNAAEIKRLSLCVAALSATPRNGSNASPPTQNRASEPIWRVIMPLSPEYIKGVEARAQPLGISASTYMQRIVAGMYPPLPELAKCVGAVRPWRRTEEDRRSREAQHKRDKDARLEVAISP
ncbi:MAG TPA: hypothetical protein VHC91_20525 [Trinickia sp.]|uniref:hypothetical protein n=1 Tax=Trinickia sp. TaxID=2571163 RepID=UPI002C45F13C|nr:hypothetical protein [Trinickia sp.]HVW52746.1 hypothetical protein [Trinickia sp.]